MNFSEQQTINFKKLLKALKLSQKALVAELKKQGYQFDATVLSNALNQRRGLPLAYEVTIKKFLKNAIDVQPSAVHAELTALCEAAFTESTEQTTSTSLPHQIPKNLVFTKAGVPLPHNSAHYIRRTFDNEVDDYIQQNRPTVLITAAPKYGVTSLFNRIAPELQSQGQGKQVLRINLLQTYTRLLENKVIENEIGIAGISAVLLSSIASRLNLDADIENEIQRLVQLPNRFSLVQLEVNNCLDQLTSGEENYCLIIDNLDKLFYQKIINSETQTDFLFLLKDTIAKPTQQVICGVSPLIWFEDQHTSLILRQTAGQEVGQFDHFKAQQLYKQLSTHCSVIFNEFTTSNITQIQEITDKLNGHPYLIHWMLEQAEYSSFAEVFDLLCTNFSTIDCLQLYRQQLMNFITLLDEIHILNIFDIDINQQPLAINNLLIKCNFINIQSTKLNTLFELAISMQ